MESQPVPNIDHLLTNIGRTAASQGEVSGNTLALGGSKLLSAPLVSAISIEQLLSHSLVTASFKKEKKEEIPAAFLFIGRASALLLWLTYQGF